MTFFVYIVRFVAIFRKKRVAVANNMWYHSNNLLEYYNYHTMYTG
jgi:hypothetical protein